MGLLDPPGLARTERPSSVMEAIQRLYIYGNSYTTYNTNAGANYSDRLLNRIRPQAWFNGGLSGTCAADIAQLMFGTSASTPRQGSSNGSSIISVGATTFPNMAYFGGVVILECIRNDAGYDALSTSGGTTTKARAAFTNHVDAMVRLARAQYRIYNTLQVAGTWTSGQPVITATAMPTYMQGSLITAAGGQFPANTYVGTIIAGVSFRLSSSPTSQVDVNTTALGTGVTMTLTPKETGTWASNVNTLCSGSFNRSTIVNGSTSSYSFNLAAATKVAWVTLAIDAAGLGITGATYSISVDGGAAITGTTNDQTRRTLTATGFHASYAQMAVDLGTLSAGWHTVVITNTGANGTALYNDCLLVESAAPPTVIIPKTLPLAAAGYNTYIAGGGTNAGTTTDLIYDGILNTVAARFPADGSVQVPDPKTPGTWNPATMIGSTDGASVHKNDLGERWTADWMMGVLNALPQRLGIGRT